jgi:hypothetical protein
MDLVARFQSLIDDVGLPRVNSVPSAVKTDRNLA